MIGLGCPFLLLLSWGTRKKTSYAKAGTEESPRGCERSVLLGQDQRSCQAQWLGLGICERFWGSACQSQAGTAQPDRLRPEFRERQSAEPDHGVEVERGYQRSESARIPFPSA